MAYSDNKQVDYRNFLNLLLCGHFLKRTDIKNYQFSDKNSYKDTGYVTSLFNEKESVFTE